MRYLNELQFFELQVFQSLGHLVGVVANDNHFIDVGYIVERC